MCTLALPPFPCYAWVSVFAHPSEQLKEVPGDLQFGANRTLMEVLMAQGNIKLV